MSKNNGKIEFFSDPLTSRGHSAVFHKGNSTLVDSVNLSSVFSSLDIKKCDILKIDIEGAEYELLYNTPDEILKRVDNILVEYHFGLQKIDKTYCKKDLIEFLVKKGFKVVRDKGEVLFATRLKKTN